MASATRTVYIVPHTHWDREWYETFETFRMQLVALWDELLSIAESDPDFRFLMDGQTVVIDDYLEVRPEARERLDRAVENGQIQVGPWFTLPDEFLVSGETLVRDLQRGIACATAHGGSMRVGYLPDSFGHAAQMPQLYRQFGLKHAAVWRGVPLSIDRVAFVWEAPDGSQVLTAYMGNSYAHGVDLPTDADALTARITGALKAIEPFHPGADVLLMNGNDHVLPQRALSRAVRDSSGRLNGTALRLARLEDYLAVLPANGWPRWRGELRSSARANVLMGTLSVRVPDKQLYTRAVRTLERLAEPAAALSGKDGDAQLHDAWTLILQNAAHDTACGSGIDAVAEASQKRSQTALRMADDILDRCLPALAGQGQIWNPSAFARQAVIDMGNEPQLTALIPGLSVGLAESLAPAVPVTVGPSTLENGHLQVVLNADGTISVLDKQRRLRFEGMNRLVDEGDAGDEYNFSPPEDSRSPAEPVRALRTSIVEQKAVRGRLEAQFDYAVYSGLSHDRRRRMAKELLLPVRMLLSLDADVPRLDIELQLDNRATDHRLRIHHPVPFPVASSVADTPYHVTRRPVTHPFRGPGAPEVELPTYPMWSFVDVSDGSAGLGVIADGLHEYEVLPGSPPELALTLLRAVGWLSRSDLSLRTGHAGPELETPGAQVPGSLHFRYSLFFHAGDWEEGAVWRMAERTLVPLVPGRGALPPTPSPVIELRPESIQMTACLPVPGGYELRLLNASDRSHEARVRLQPLPARVDFVNLAGEERARLSTDAEGVTLPMRAWEISTLRVSR